MRAEKEIQPAKLRVAGGLKSLRADESGVTAIEFGMVGLPFFMMLFGIIAVGLYFFTTFTLENAVENASRLIRTGQLQTVTQTGGDYSYSASILATCAKTDPVDVCFKKQVCKSLPAFVDCANKVRVNVQNFPNFAGIAPPSCLAAGGGLITTAASTFNPGSASDVVLATACYEWELAGQIPFLKLGQMANGSALIQASATFMTEPYN